jgi:hypothetical protein
MSPGGSVYHYGSYPERPKLEAAWAQAKGQSLCPIFKLVSPDGTGGSLECIIQNPLRLVVKQAPPLMIRIGITTVQDYVREISIGNEIRFVDVSHLIVTERKWQGSYNYGETVQRGYRIHKKYDEDSDNRTGTDCYIDPPLGSTLHTRRFPESAAGEYLATQSDIVSG